MGFLVTHIHAFATQSPFLIKDPAALVEIHLILLIFQLDGNRHARWSKGRIMVEADLDCRCRYWALIHVVGEVLVKVIRIVIAEDDAFQGVIF